MEVRAKKALGQHFLTDQGIAKAIVDALETPSEDVAGRFPVLEIGPGMGVLTQYLLQRDDIELKLVEIDGESVEYLMAHFPGMTNPARPLWRGPPSGPLGNAARGPFLRELP